MKSLYYVIIIFLLLSSCREIIVDKTRLKGWDYRLFQETPAWELAKAVQDGRVSRIKSIIQEDSTLINYQEPRFGETLLMLAIWNDDYKSFITLLENNANVNIYDTYDGTSAIILTCEYNLGKKYVEKLLEYGANPNDIEAGDRRKGNSTRYTPLRGASENGDIESVKLLLDAGADINYHDEFGSSALGKSVMRGYYDVTLLLLENGADYTRPLAKGVDQPLNIVDLMRGDLTELNSTKYFYKKKVIDFLKKHNVDYRKSPIPSYTLQRIKQLYPNSWQEYIEKY